jgi:Glycosyltransferase family 87
VWTGAGVVLSTEILGAIHALARGPVVALWLLAAAAFIVFFKPPSLRFASLKDSLTDSLLAASIAAIVGIIAVVAILSPPNSADAMAYHMPRVIYWIQQRGVAFFATPYLNQIMLQPFAEYFMLHTYLLAGGDRFVNLVQWSACAISILSVSLIAQFFGASSRGQILAALFCATLPNGILQASGAKNDYLLAAWLVAAVYFLYRGNTILAGLAIGLAIGTKATAYLFLPPLLLLTGWRWRKSAVIFACALALNLPQFARNIHLSGSLLGFDSAQADGRYRWSNEKFGWRETMSNAIRHASDQLGGRSDRWNATVFNAAIGLHRTTGTDPNDPATTWPGESFTPPRNANHEANAGNRWHLAILCVCLAALLLRRGPMLAYALALVAGFVLFCFYLKWQPYMARLFLPLFVLASPIPGVFGGKVRPAAIQLALCLLLMNNARPFLFENWVRPLKGSHSLLRTAREDNYFADMTQWNNAESHRASVHALADLNCPLVGLDTNHLQLEYPIQALLLERRPGTRFVHTAVANPSATYASEETPCAVLCLDCVGDSSRAVLYRDYGQPRAIGRFLLFPPP